MLCLFQIDLKIPRNAYNYVVGNFESFLAPVLKGDFKKRMTVVSPVEFLGRP